MYEDTAPSTLLSKIVMAIFILAIADLAFINWLVLRSAKTVSGDSQNFYSAAGSPVPSVSPTPTVQPQGQNRQEQTLDKLLSPSPSATPSSKTTSEQVVVQNQYKEIFVPLGGGNTKSSSFADLYGSEITIDTTKYSAIDYITFEASIWVEGGNGRAWAQVINVSDNNPLIESQISNNTSTPTLKSSSKIPYSNGSKTYRIQAKTEQSDHAAYVDNGRLKIVLK